MMLSHETHPWYHRQHAALCNEWMNECRATRTTALNEIRLRRVEEYASLSKSPLNSI